MKLLLYRENCMQHVQCNAEIWKQNALGLAEHNLITAATACIRMPAPINLWLRHSCASIATHETAAPEPVACSSFVPRPMADGRSCFLEKSGETFREGPPFVASGPKNVSCFTSSHACRWVRRLVTYRPPVYSLPLGINQCAKQAAPSEYANSVTDDRGRETTLGRKTSAAGSLSQMTRHAHVLHQFVHRTNPSE